MLGLCFCVRAFSSCSERGPLFIAVRGPLTIVASLVAEHRLQTRRLSSCGTRASLLRGMWDLPGPGLEPMSPALAGRFSTTEPPGKPSAWLFNFVYRGIEMCALKPCTIPVNSNPNHPSGPAQGSQLQEASSEKPTLKGSVLFGSESFSPHFSLPSPHLPPLNSTCALATSV